jgi:hypothetical protein
LDTTKFRGEGSRKLRGCGGAMKDENLHTVTFYLMLPSGRALKRRTEGEVGMSLSVKEKAA